MSENMEKPVRSESRGEKVVKMPGHDEMMRKLKDKRIVGMTPQSDRVYERFVSSVADSEMVGQGLTLAWELALHNELKNYPQPVYAAMSLWFEPTIDAVTPDTDVASQAKEFMSKVKEAARKGRE